MRFAAEGPAYSDSTDFYLPSPIIEQKGGHKAKDIIVSAASEGDAVITDSIGSMVRSDDTHVPDVCCWLRAACQSVFERTTGGADVVTPRLDHCGIPGLGPEDDARRYVRCVVLEQGSRVAGCLHAQGSAVLRVCWRVQGAIPAHTPRGENSILRQGIERSVTILTHHFR
jgi:hypothetical protein